MLGAAVANHMKASGGYLGMVEAMRQLTGEKSPAAAADLTVVCLTINDWNAGTAVATYKAGLVTLVDRCLTTGDVLLMTGCPSDPAQGKASYAAQAALRDAGFEVAATRGLAAPIDGTVLFGGSFGGGLMFDSVHPDAAGQARIAEAVRARVMI